MPRQLPVTAAQATHLTLRSGIRNVGVAAGNKYRLVVGVVVNQAAAGRISMRSTTAASSAPACTAHNAETSAGH
jgi:hypothetical protein